MAEINLGDVSSSKEPIISQPVKEQKTAEKIDRQGMSKEETLDPEKIRVEIADYRTPLVVLFGPQSSGKTMTLVRLTRYLWKQGLSVKPVASFRPAYDTHYKELCDHFDSMILNEDAALSTDRIKFMLVQVLKNGHPLCQILEAPGESYFSPDPNHWKDAFPQYVNNIMSKQNRKIYLIIVEPASTNSSMTPKARCMYAQKIKEKLKPCINPHDRVLFVYNKIDETPFVIMPGKVNMGEAFRDVENHYPNIFVPFRNENPITRFWKKYNCDMIPFQTGYFNKAADGTYTFQEGPDVYPRQLWNKIMRLVRG